MSTTELLSTISTTPQPRALSANTPTTSSGKTPEPFWGEDGFTFGDILDLFNPLQHVPIVSQIYRDLTGDQTSKGAQVLGGGIFGGIVGLVSSFFDSAIEETTGKAIGDHAVALFQEPETPTEGDAPNVTTLANATRQYQEITGLPWLEEKQGNNVNIYG